MNSYLFLIAALLLFASCSPEPNKSNADYATQKYADKHAQIYTLQPCECVDGVAPNGCGHLLPIIKTDRPNKGEVLYFALDKTARIDTVWIEQATGLDCENYRLLQMVKH